jgi:small subunit ribosomal protein S19
MARSARKGPYVQDCLLKKVRAVRESNKREVIKTWSRRSMVLPNFVGMTFAVHNGKKFVNVFVTENMVGHCLGEFAATRSFKMHSGQRQASPGAGS